MRVHETYFRPKDREKRDKVMAKRKVSILRALVAHGKLNQSEMAPHVSCNFTTLREAIQELTLAGHIAKARVPRGRSRCHARWTITEAGRAFLEGMNGF